jgi:ParB-like chromosome segregation protein Spo0J
MQIKQAIARIPIEQIYPDPEQPRKRLPRDLAIATRDGMDARTLLQELRNRAATQSGLAAFLKGLDDLATSIFQVGQLAPIRVYTDGSKRYVIEMGERRWLAHLILHLERGESTFSHIDAIIAPKRSDATIEQQTLQRRMAENVHRAEFSPLEMARGLAERIVQVIEQNSELNRSKAEELVGQENGITARRVRQYLSLLNLSDEAQRLAQEGGLTERALRGVLKIQDADVQVQAIRKLISGGPEKTNSPRATNVPDLWAETFLKNVLTIGHSNEQTRPYERALRVQLKRNPRARKLLNKILHTNAPTNKNRRVSRDTASTKTFRRLKRNARRRNDDFELTNLRERNPRRNSRRRR